MQPPTYSAGDLRHRVDVLGPTRQPNAYGEAEESWGVVFAGVPALCLQVGASLVVVDNQAQHHAVWSVVLRFRRDLAIDSRLDFEGHALRVVGVQEVDRRRWLLLTCEERPDEPAGER
jgi:head-tail adaptor